MGSCLHLSNTRQEWLLGILLHPVCVSHRQMTIDLAVYLASVRSHCCLRSKIILYLLGDDSLVYVKVRDPVFVLLAGRHSFNVMREECRKSKDLLKTSHRSSRYWKQKWIVELDEQELALEDSGSAIYII